MYICAHFHKAVKRFNLCEKLGVHVCVALIHTFCTHTQKSPKRWFMMIFGSQPFCVAVVTAADVVVNKLTGGGKNEGIVLGIFHASSAIISQPVFFSSFLQVNLATKKIIIIRAVMRALLNKRRRRAKATSKDPPRWAFWGPWMKISFLSSLFVVQYLTKQASS